MICIFSVQGNIYLLRMAMTNRFEYNFTRENEFEQLRQRCAELESENDLLKQNLEELLRVNNVLADSIEEFNNENHPQVMRSSQSQPEQLLEVQYLRRELEKYKRSGQNDEDQLNDKQTESLVNVLEALIESFKQMQQRKEEEIQELMDNYRNHQIKCEQAVGDLESSCQNKFQSIQGLLGSIKRKDQSLSIIQNKIAQLQDKQIFAKNRNIRNSHPRQGDQDTVKALNYTIEEKNKLIQTYVQLINNLKIKLLEKFS